MYQHYLYAYAQARADLGGRYVGESPGAATTEQDRVAIAVGIHDGQEGDAPQTKAQLEQIVAEALAPQETP